MQGNIASVKQYLLELQDHLCQTLESEDGQARFQEDNWQHVSGGGGRTRVLSQGTVLEQAGVNFSHIWGKTLPPAATIAKPELAGRSFQALGVSCVIHPRNPYAPTSHANMRFIITEKAQTEPTWWFGGGFDLTPYYGFKEDCYHWHRMAKSACDPFGSDIYLRYKQQADDYFYLKHRSEARGIGGIFYDDLNAWGFTTCFDFMQSVGKHFILAYQPLLAKRKNMPYSEKERGFQCYRRGRYVEFNLIYDRGTLFGLQAGGRTESILMSLPPEVHWRYNWQPQDNSPEAELYTYYLKPRDWLREGKP